MQVYIRLILFIFSGIAFSLSTLSAQEDLDTWYLQGSGSTFPTGTRTMEWYKKSSTGASQTIVVAVIDGGTDIQHPDLRPNLWINPGEIPGNHLDDDQNGYVDDIYGWNFIGGPEGQSVVNESLEVTREYAKERSIYENLNPDKLKGKKKMAFEDYLEKKALVEQKRAAAEAQIAQLDATSEIVMDALMAVKNVIKDDSINLDLLENSDNEDVVLGAKIIRNVEEQGVEIESVDWLIEIAEADFQEVRNTQQIVLDYTYNPDFDSRKIVGDVYADFENRTYGNNIVYGAHSMHGTHVAGIIGAARDNGLGVDGIADNVAIMTLKVVPDGDERDKDVANGIIYAVDNGALVINMSFGKGYSPEKQLVDDAMRYAAKHDVLLVLAAGNEATNIDAQPKFPNDKFIRKPIFSPGHAKNLLSVGALSPEGGEHSIAEFSNYGKADVDVFAPGVYIYSTTPDSTYGFLSGTSMATPVVSGIAAMIRSRYPALSAQQVKEIIMESSRPLKGDLIEPGTFDLVPATDLCVSGGMADMVRAMQLAAKTKGKAKIKKRKSASQYTPIPIKT